MPSRSHPHPATAPGHGKPAIGGLWRDAHGPARLLRTDGRNADHALLRSGMWQDRKRVLIDRLGWDLQSPDGLHELDQYDGDDTLYLIVHQPGSNRHLGSVRLLPSTGPHMLAEIFAGLCADGVPVGHDVWEITRLVTAPDLARADAMLVRRQLSVALLEHGLAHGISRYTMVTHMAFLPALLAVGWDAEPLGLPQGEGEATIAALQIGVDAAALARLRSNWGIAGPVLAPPAAQGF